MLRVLCAGLAVASAAWGQSEPDALTGLRQNAARRSAEWSTLALNLEQRVTRLLPCDPRVRSAIEETSRASGARIAALTEYWMAVSGKSRSQTEAIRRLAAQEEARKDEWTGEQTHAEEERAAVAEQNGFLADSVSRFPRLADAQKSLAAATQALQQIETQVRARESSGNQLLGEFRDLLAASQARQNDIDTHLKWVNAEGARWSAYYDARLRRGQMECAITNPRTEPRETAPAPRGGKQK